MKKYVIATAVILALFCLGIGLFADKPDKQVRSHEERWQKRGH